MMIFVDVMIQISFAIGINSFLEIHFDFSIIWLVTQYDILNWVVL